MPNFLPVSSDYTPEFIADYFGTVKLQTSNELIAGSYCALHFDVKIGKYGIDDGGHIKLAWPVSNAFGIPQFNQPSKENFTKITATGNAKLKFEFDHSGYIRPFMPCITIKVFDGVLEEGDILTILLGDKNTGSKGLKTQTYVENNVEFKFLLDPFGTNDYVRLQDSPRIDIVADKPASLTVINPSQAIVDKPMWVLIRGNDKWGNLSPNYKSTLTLSIDDEMNLEEFKIENDGFIRLDNIKLSMRGIYSLRATDAKNRLSAVGNPIEVLSISNNLRLFWGDLHGQTGETVGSGTIDEYLHFGKHVSGIDFISHAANAFQVTKDIWKKTQAAIKEFHEPGRYITFLGYEWSGVTSAGGDHNVYYLNDDQPIHRGSHALIDDKTDLDTDRYPVSELYKEFEGREDVMIIPHIGGRRATLDVFDENLTPFIEIVSVHGHFEWFAKEALERELKTGFICSSDTHSGRPGDSFPVTYIETVKAGLTGVYTTDLSREALWKAFKQRHVYGTTGKRIVMEFFCNGAMMGDEISLNKAPTFKGKIIGTAPLEKVEIYQGLNLIHSQSLLENKTKIPHKFIIRWTGARTQFRRRNIDWSGSLKLINGEFKSIDEFAFDLPWEGIISQDNNLVEFISTTAGDYDGFIVEYEGDQTTRVEFSSDVFTTMFDPAKITEPLLIKLGEVELSLEILPVYEEKYSSNIEFNFTYQEFKGQRGAYYLKVLQLDGEKAWTSPIFVNW